MIRRLYQRLRGWLTFEELSERAAGAFVDQATFDAAQLENQQEHAEIVEEIRSFRSDLDALSNEARMHERLVQR